MKHFLSAFAAVLAFAVAAEDIDLAKATVRASYGTAEIVQHGDDDSIFTLKGIAKTDENPTNRYVIAMISLPKPVNMVNQVLRFQVCSSTSENIVGFFVRGYNKGVSGKYPLAWKLGSPQLNITPHFREITLLPKHNFGLSQWSAQQVDNTEPTAINRLQIFVMAKDNTKEVDVQIKDLDIDRDYQDGVKQFFAQVGEVKSICTSGYTQSPVIEVENEEGEQVLEIQGHSIRQLPSGRTNYYEAMAVQFANPVSLKDRAVSFSIKREDDVNMIFIHGYNEGNNTKKCDISYALRCNKIPADTWTPVTLGLAPSVVQPKNLSGNAPDKIARLEIIFTTQKLDEDFSVEVKDFKVSDPVQ